MTFIWSLTLYQMAEGYRVVIKGNGHTVEGKGRTPQEAHRAAECKLVVKPWVTAERPAHETRNEPPPGLLMSMAIRMDHCLGVPGYYDSFEHTGGATVASHQQRLDAALATARQMWEEVTGRGFYRPEREAEYAERLAVKA